MTTEYLLCISSHIKQKGLMYRGGEENEVGFVLFFLCVIIDILPI